MDKLCCDCSHMDDDSEYDSDLLLCHKGHFRAIAFVSTIRENIRRAATCPDYTTEPVERPTMTVGGMPSIGWMR